jgi:cell fate regulator YaaT (PSP1 superfamily)
MMRYGEMRLLGRFKTELTDLKPGELYVVKTERGTETGTMVYSVQPSAPVNPPTAPATPAAPATPITEPPREDISGEIVRRLSPDDTKELNKIYVEKVPKEIAFAQQKTAELRLEMEVVFVEHLLGGEKIIFYYLSEGRVDFRELVRELAKEYKTRIEMKQIGVRDEARLMGTFEHCGRELCCRTFLKELEPVTMKMAKNQKTTMDPAKISGRCGRLMCCLKYEDDTYTLLKSTLPKRGARVQTAKGEGEVIDVDVMAQQAIVELDNNERIKLNAQEITKIIKDSTLKVEKDD